MIVSLVASLVLFAAIAGSTALPTAFAAGGRGVGSSGGGDLKAMFPELKLRESASEKRKEEIAALFSNDSLRVQLLRWINGNRDHFKEARRKKLSHEELARDTAPADPTTDFLLEDKPWLTGGLLWDLLASNYLFSEDRIFIDGIEKDAFTYHTKHVTIFFNLDRLARYDVSLEELTRKLQALLYHEHLRHIGIPDEDYAYGKLAMNRKFDRDTSYNGDRNPKRIGVYALGFEPMLAIARALAPELGSEGVLCTFQDGPAAGKQTACPGLYQFDYAGAFSKISDESRRRVFERLNEEMIAFGFNQRTKVYGERLGPNDREFLGSWIGNHRPEIESQAWENFERETRQSDGFTDLNIYSTHFGHYVMSHYCVGSQAHPMRTQIYRCSELQIAPGLPSAEN